MSKILNLPIYKDWLFYYVVLNLVNAFSEILGWIKDPFAGEALDTLSQILLSYFIYVGIPIIVRYRLKVRRGKLDQAIQESAENLIFISFATDDRLVVEKMLEKLKNKTSAFYWVQENIQGGQVGYDVIADKVEKSVGSLIFFSKNSEESDFIKEREIPLIKEKYKKEENYIVIPIRVGKTDTGYQDGFSNLQTIPSKSQTISRLTENDLDTEVDKLIRSLPKNLQSLNTAKPRRDISIILTALCWIFTAFVAYGTFFTANQISRVN